MASEEPKHNPFAAPTAYDAAPSAWVAHSEAADIRARLGPPAVIMIVIAVFSTIAMVVDFGFRMYNLSNPQFLPADNVQRMSMLVGNYTGAFIDILNFVCQFLVITGCLAMMKGRDKAKARMAAFISMIPCISGCCVLNIPFGIWAFMVLNQPDVEAFFDRQDRAEVYLTEIDPKA